MKPNQEPDDDKRLGAVLGEWSVDNPLPSRFQDAVWQRIAQAEVRPESAFWAGLIRLVEVVLPRPKFAFAFVAILMVLGVAGGAVTARVKSSHLDETLRARYVQTVDPYRAETPRP
jgi:hypothetical protein